MMELIAATRSPMVERHCLDAGTFEEAVDPCG
jgi:hypothetical protein